MIHSSHLILDSFGFSFYKHPDPLGHGINKRVEYVKFKIFPFLKSNREQSSRIRGSFSHSFFED